MNKNYYWIDLLRFFAAFIVLLNHSRGVFWCEYDDMQGNGKLFFYSITRMGHEAVLIFFVLSGYLVGGAAIKRIGIGTFDLKSYSINRSVRILLPLFSAILLYLITAHILNEEVNYWTCLGNLLSLQGILVPSLVGPFWSLSYEVWFYFLMGAVALLLSKRNVWTLFSLVLVLSVFAFLKPIYLLVWLIGAFAYVCQPQQRNGFLFYTSILMMMLMVLCYQFGRDSHGIGNLSFSFNIGLIELVFSLFGAIFIQQIVLMRPEHKWSNCLNYLGIKLAVFSYTLYLVHQTICLFIFKYFNMSQFDSLSWDNLLLYSLILIIVLFISWCIYCLFEKHTALVKKAINRWLLK